MITLRIRSVSWFIAGLAVALGIGGTVASWAASSVGSGESTFVPVTPIRVLDTRDPVNLGLAGPFTSAVGQDLLVTGSIPTSSGAQTVVPAGATGVMLNVTAVSPAARGFISIRPADAPGAPATSSLNVEAGQTLPNAVTVSLPVAGVDAGKIEISFDAYGVAGPRTDMLIDVVGYFTHTGIQNLDDRVSAIEANVRNKTVLSYTGPDEVLLPGFDYGLVRSVGTFTKLRAGSTVRLDWSAHARTVGDFCHYQLRIDGKANTGASALTYASDQEGSAVAYADDSAIATFAEFTGVPAGVHTVQIYVRGLAASCTLNFGNFNQQVSVEEYQAASTSSFGLDPAGADEGGVRGGV